MNEEETKMAKGGEDQHEFRTTNLKILIVIMIM